MEHRAQRLHIFRPYIHPRPMGCSQRSKPFFPESSHVAYQNKGNEQRAPCQHMFDLTHPTNPLVGLTGKLEKNYNMKFDVLLGGFSGSFRTIKNYMAWWLKSAGALSFALSQEQCSISLSL